MASETITTCEGNPNEVAIVTSELEETEITATSDACADQNECPPTDSTVKYRHIIAKVGTTPTAHNYLVYLDTTTLGLGYKPSIPRPNHSNALIAGIVGGLVLMLTVAIVLVVWIVRRKKYRNVEPLYEEILPYVQLYNVTTNCAYKCSTIASTTQQIKASHSFSDSVENNRLHEESDAKIDSTSRSANNEGIDSHCQGVVCEEESCIDSNEATEEDLEQQQASEAYDHVQASGPYDRVQDYERQQASGPYERVQDYERRQASGPYERVQDYEQQPASGPYERVQDYERRQVSGPYEQQVSGRIQEYERQQASGPYERVQDYERQQASGPYDRVQDYERQQASGPYDRVQDYERQQARLSGPYDRVQDYEQLLISDAQDRVPDFEQQQVNEENEQPASGTYGQTQDYEQQPASDPQEQVNEVQDHEQQQANEVQGNEQPASGPAQDDEQQEASGAYDEVQDYTTDKTRLLIQHA